MKDQKTLLLAINLHNGQMRRGNSEPYVSHCIRVADSVYTLTENAVLYRAALLHDTVEDTGVTLAELKDKYDVCTYACELVDLLTKAEGQSRADYLERLINSNNNDAIIIKIMDALDNAVFREEDVAWHIENNIDMRAGHDRYIKTAKRLVKALNVDSQLVGIINYRIAAVVKMGTEFFKELKTNG